MEAKAARIKDWVTNKLRDLEEQNEHLKAQNERANAQMEILRQKLEQLQIDRDSAAAAAATSTASDCSILALRATTLSGGEVSQTGAGLNGDSHCLRALSTQVSPVVWLFFSGPLKYFFFKSSKEYF